MAIHLLGIRHHGPGSAKNVLAKLEELSPDLILLEGPVEMEGLMSFVKYPDMEPPVAMFAYQTDKPENAVFYPMTQFSPEWQVIRYALHREVEIRCMDLPLVHSMALERSDERAGNPFSVIAEIEGMSDGDEWWERKIELRKTNDDVFEAIEEVVTALREAYPEQTTECDLLREAWMRKMMRSAEKDNEGTVVVVCGAWHVPALRHQPKVKEDNERLKGLPKVKVEQTWIPWTYDRMTYYSGYGAGIFSPGWYEYKWLHPDDDGTLWVTGIADRLRKKEMDISVAHVIETVRLANATAALRGLASPGLPEFNEAAVTIMGFGDSMIMEIIQEELIVGNRLGTVPDDVPKVPLLADVERTMKTLRLRFSSEIKTMVLDLRKPNDLDKSVFFTRLSLLGVKWCTQDAVSGKGTFKEQWTLHHQPEDVLNIIEKAIYGNTLEEACRHYLTEEMQRIQTIAALSQLLQQILPADLPSVVELMTAKLDALSAATTDVVQMIETLPALVDIVHYGNVRQLDFTNVGRLMDSLLGRIVSGGVFVCMNIDEEVAEEMLELLSRSDYAIHLMTDEEKVAQWNDFLRLVYEADNVHPLLKGFVTRLLTDRQRLSLDDVRQSMSFHTSIGNSPIDMAYWFEGFLQSSATVLLIDDGLWSLIDTWVASQPDETFLELLPILRRTFSEYSPAERRKIGEKVSRLSINGGEEKSETTEQYEPTDAMRVIPLMRRLIGL